MSSQLLSSRATKLVETLNDELKAQGLRTVDPKTFCILPFVHLSTSTIGEIKLCCRGGEVGHIGTQSLSQVWNSPKNAGDPIRFEQWRGS